MLTSAPPYLREKFHRFEAPLLNQRVAVEYWTYLAQICSHPRLSSISIHLSIFLSICLSFSLALSLSFSYPLMCLVYCSLMNILKGSLPLHSFPFRTYPTYAFKISHNFAIMRRFYARWRSRRQTRFILKIADFDIPSGISIFHFNPHPRAGGGTYRNISSLEKYDEKSIPW